MKVSQGKLLIFAAVPMIMAASPSFAFTCDTSSPPVWDTGVTIPKTDAIGNGTKIGSGFSLSGYVHVGTCGNLGWDDKEGGSISAHATLYNNVTMEHKSGVSQNAVLHSYATLNNSHVSTYAEIGYMSTITDSLIGSYANIGSHTTVKNSSSISSKGVVGMGSTIDGSKMAYGAQAGTSANLTGAYIGRQTSLGDGVTVENNAQVQGYSVVDSNVTIGAGAYIGSHSHICADVGPGMYIHSYSTYGCQ
jgi:UDP-3-O-[3-hydroxymyristoyl] glucosamine N-acyltransferase